MSAAILKFLELMRKQGRATDDDIDKVKAKGHISKEEATTLKKVKKRSE